jgi:creatinine amidohydrolase/Fe(II)-dependent formamide hydrolase-like protein
MTRGARSKLDQLLVIDRLDVGPIRVEPERVSAAYRIGEDAFELSYKYEEPVFEPADRESTNLASMVLAQVALNYGLFCREIAFHGEFDEIDRRFLTEMAQNTAREIYVKKFLEPNPFLVGDVARLPVVVEKSYSRANLVFDPETAKSAPSGPVWSTTPDRHAVLSSGGKDSLLSFGLVRELGFEVHPLYVNESGRHWFTALNAYRHFESQIPSTARVWTNSDRLFSWMLRQLPFVRKDFQSVRSDAYPIRLWTVAVFLFGVLPLVRKRGIGRILIGDEFDTTERTSHQGITHYDGLYDQSRFFDEALTRYFGRKGFGVSQFSLLRPLSELLVQKTLAERYPMLFEHQVSCHATHKEKDRVKPCGACEKCRRIVGMLVAVGQDPARCGFGKEQIEKCLAALTEQGVHQEKAAAAHLGHLLHQRGAIAEARIGKVPARPQPEVMKLRFDPERSPLSGVPVNLRESAYRVLLQHAEGALQRTGRVWSAIDVFSGTEIRTPYRFESSTKVSKDGEPGLESRFLLGELTWPEAQERFRQVDVALLPVGSIEQHGPHLPLDTDAFDADYLAKRVAAACPDPKPIVLPLISYGVSYAHEDFSGTLSVSPDTMAKTVYEIGMNVAKHGITKLVIVNGHGGNGPALHFAAQLINRDAHIFTCVDTGETSDADINAMSDVPNDVHAGDIETSTTLAVRPELVRMDRAEKFIPRFSNKYLDFTSQRSVGWYARTARITPTGIFGDPTRATREKGERMWEIMIHHLVELVTSIQGLPLDEIYQKRY